MLLEMLADGQRYVGDIRDAARDQGITQTTLDRAVDDLGCVVTKERGVQHGRWLIALPPAKAVTPTHTEVTALAVDGPANPPDSATGGTAATPAPCHPEAAAEGSPPVGSSPTEGDSSLRLGMTGHRDDGHTTDDGDDSPEELDALKAVTPTYTEVTALAVDELPNSVKALTPTHTEVTALAVDEPAKSPKALTPTGTEVTALAADDPPAFTPKTVARYVALAKDPPGYDDRHPGRANMLTSRERR